MKKQFLITVLVLISFLVVGVCKVLGDESARKSLKGLTGVYVLIEDLGPNKQEVGGLTTSQLQSDVELKLRKVGIRVLTKEEWSATKGSPYLYVRISPVVQPDFYAYSIEVELKQVVVLLRAPIYVSGATWSTGSAGSVGKTNFVKGLRDSVGDLIDQFINDYLAVNPITPAAKPNVK
jgi:hypothetical protein